MGAAAEKFSMLRQKEYTQLKLPAALMLTLRELVAAPNYKKFFGDGEQKSNSDARRRTHA